MYSPVFQHIPDDWRGRWRLIRTMMGRVYNVNLPEVGRKPRLSKKLTSQLAGRRLPPSVLEWIAFGQDLHKCNDAIGASMAHYSLEATELPEHDSISLAKYYDCMQWGVGYSDFDEEDPPVSAYAFVPRRNQWTLRKSYGRAPVTQFALHCALNHTPWLHGWTSYSYMGSDVTDPDAFLEQLRRTKGVQVSDPFGSLTFVEGIGWVAYIVNGYWLFGRDTFLRLYFTKGVRLSEIPKPIRDLVQMKRSHLRS
jgi:hypothetical protein